MGVSNVAAFGCTTFAIRLLAVKACLWILQDLLLTNCLFAPPAWSPDGKWLMLTASDEDPTAILSPSPIETTVADRSTAPQATVSSRQIWAYHVASGNACKIAATDGFFSGYTWSPDSQSVAYVSVAGCKPTDPEPKRRSELFLLDRSGKIRQIMAQSASQTGDSHDATTTIAWSPNGLVIAAELTCNELVLLDAAKLKTTGRLAGGSLASFSPDSRFLVYYRKSKIPGFYSIRTDGWTDDRLVVESAKPTQRPLWEPDSDAFIAARVVANRTPVQELDWEVVRASVHDAGSRSIWKARLPAESAQSGRFGWFLKVDRRDAYLRIRPVNETPAQFEWQGVGYERRRWHPLDSSNSERPIPIGEPSLSPDGDTIAFQFGDFGDAAPVGLFHLDEQTFTTIATTNAQQARGIRAVADAIVRQKSQNAAAGQPSASIRGTSSRSPGVLTKRVYDILNLFPWPADRSPVQNQAGPASNRAPGDPFAHEVALKMAGHGLQLVKAFQSSRSVTGETQISAFAVLFYYVRGQFDAAADAALEARSERSRAHDPLAGTLLLVIRGQSLQRAGNSQEARRCLLEAQSERRSQLLTSDVLGSDLNGNHVGWDPPNKAAMPAILLSDPVLARIEAVLADCQTRNLQESPQSN